MLQVRCLFIFIFRFIYFDMIGIMITSGRHSGSLANVNVVLFSKEKYRIISLVYDGGIS